MPNFNNGNSRATRNLFSRVKTAKNRKISSTNWLQRQLNDPYVTQAKLEGYNSRAAFKLIEINDKFRLFKPKMTIIDLGAAPGGWSQVASQLTKADRNNDEASRIVAIDLLPIEPIAGVTSIVQDFMDPSAKKNIVKILGHNKANIVMSDMAANTTGHKDTDHLRIINLCEEAIVFSLSVLDVGGHFITKIFQGGSSDTLLEILRANFSSVKYFKPPSSRKESSECYLIAMSRKSTKPLE